MLKRSVHKVTQSRKKPLKTFRNVAFFAFFSLWLSHAALAADVYIKKHPPQAQPRQQPKTQPQNNESTTFANQYYKNCLAGENEVLKGDNLQMMCACTAAKISENMNAEDLQAMGKDTPEGLAARNKMVLEVYAPCMEFPAESLMQHRCVNTPALHGKTTDLEALCSCVAKSVAGYIARHGPAVMESALQENPENLDPMSALVNSPEFDRQSRAGFLKCLGR